MKKSNLKNSMIVKFKGDKDGHLVCGERLEGLDGYMTLNIYDDDLKYARGNSESDREWDIEEVYIMKWRGAGLIKLLSNVRGNDNLQLIWKRKSTIDWNKVSRGTKVQVRNSEKEEWVNRYFRYFSTIVIGKNGESQDIYWTATHLKDEFTGEGEQGCGGYKYCRIHPDVEIKEEWYK